MKAIILAAGVGKRLWPVTQHRPKCLIQIGGQTLLHRYLMTLASLGIQRADIVVGYKQEMIRSAVEADSCGLRVNFLVNEQFHRGSISSLWVARTVLDDDVIIMAAQTINRSSVLAPPAARPVPYQKSDKFKFLGMYGETTDMTGGFGAAGVDAIEKFLDAGGTLITTLGAAVAKKVSVRM